jgi:hypothetical protein
MNDKIYIYDAATHLEIIREMSDEEQTQRNLEIENALLENEAAQEAQVEARAVKVSAYQKLGLTEAEIEALLPSIDLPTA